MAIDHLLAGMILQVGMFEEEQQDPNLLNPYFRPYF